MQRKSKFAAIAIAIAMVGCTQDAPERPADLAVKMPKRDVTRVAKLEKAGKKDAKPAAPRAVAADKPAEPAPTPAPAAPAMDPGSSLSGLLGASSSTDSGGEGALDLLGATSGDAAIGLGNVGTRGRGSGSAYGKSAGRVRASAKGMKKRVRRAPTRQPIARPTPPPPLPEPALDEISDRSKLVDHGVNGWTFANEDKLSTFAVDVDTGSYTYAKRSLERARLPAQAGVRVEEWVNAFSYDYAGPRDRHPFAVHLASAPSPVTEKAQLLRVGVQGKRISKHDRKPAHVTFLVDVSGSMSRQDKLPMAKRAMNVLVDNLDSRDSIAIATYAGAHRLVLPATRANRAGKTKIRRAIENLSSGGGTNMGDGMTLAYREANKHLSSDRMSRVVVLSDGDANIGRTSHKSILDTVRGYVSEGVTLSTVGFGTGNYNDHLMERLADAGNGNYSYIDSDKTARRVFEHQLVSTLQVIAQDVKIQVDFDPEQVERYRLIGYENRDVADRDFRNDKVDAGEIGAGHTVTALYEVIPAGSTLEPGFATVRLRYKKPRGSKATEVAHTVSSRDMRRRFASLDANSRYAAGVAIAAEIFRGSPHTGELGLNDALRIVQGASDGEFRQERRDFARLLEGLTRRNLLVRR
jgi:Ca-activated chloride channel family protein